MKKITKKIVLSSMRAHSGQMITGCMVDFDFSIEDQIEWNSAHDFAVNGNFETIEERARKNAEKLGYIDRYGRLTHLGHSAV